MRLLFFLALIRLLELIYSACLYEKNGLCMVCPDGFYNLNSLLPSSSENNCIQKDAYLELNLLVKKGDIFCQEAACKQFFQKVFESLRDALDYASSEARKFKYSKLNIVLWSAVNETFILEDYKSNVDPQFNGLFRWSNASITIMAALCETYKFNECITIERKVKILVKTAYLAFFIARELTLRNLAFDGMELFRTQCISDCCGDFFKEDFEGKKICNFNIADWIILSAFGLFTIENRIDSSEARQSQPTLFLKSCEFNNFYTITSASIIALVELTPYGGSVFFEDVQVLNSFFPKGEKRKLN